MARSGFPQAASRGQGDGELGHPRPALGAREVEAGVCSEKDSAAGGEAVARLERMEDFPCVAERGLESGLGQPAFVDGPAEGGEGAHATGGFQTCVGRIDEVLPEACFGVLKSGETVPRRAAKGSMRSASAESR